MENYIRTDGNQNVIELQLSVLVFEEGNYYVAFCPSMNLSSYGDSVQDAKEAFDEIMKDYIVQGEQNKTLHQDLTKNGWKFFVMDNKKTAEPPAQVELNIPAGLLKKQFNENWKVAVN